ncbi:MAG: hypothetical protein ACI8PT_004451, partial [Gammaproteobacteria bacterium]
FIEAPRKLGKVAGIGGQNAPVEVEPVIPLK